MVALRMFAQAREAAGSASSDFDGSTVGDVLDAAVAAFGDDFARVLDGCRVWCNGEPVERTDAVSPGDEVAVLPPVSGG